MMETSVVKHLLDFKKQFDIFDHNILGVRSTAYNWFS